MAIITDHRPHIRELGLRKIMKAKAAKPNIRTRRFKVPTNLNFNAGEYYEVIDWSELAITEPPVVNAMTDTELWQFIRMDSNYTFSKISMPHTSCRETCKGGY